MEKQLQFGRENKGYGVIAKYPDKEEIVVSVHLGMKQALSHLQNMQMRDHRITFYVQEVFINVKRLN